MPPRAKPKATASKDPAINNGTRKRKLSRKAKQLVSPSDSEDEPPKKKKAKAAKAKKVVENIETDTELGFKRYPTIKWSDELTFSLLTAIEESSAIKQSLFPAPGAMDLKVGGKGKGEFQAELANTLFEDHPDYMAAYAVARTPAQKAWWGEKVKNRLNKMQQKTLAYTRDMGETGAGIEREEDINMELNNAFTSKWAVIKAACPWYFNMRILIAQRPNSIPVGIGSNEAAVDFGVLGTMAQDNTSDDELAPVIKNTDGATGTTSTVEEDLLVDTAPVNQASSDYDPGSDSSDEDEVIEEEGKVVDRWGTKATKADGKKKEVQTPGKTGKTGLCGTAEKAILSSRKANSASVRFADMAVKEQETLARSFDLKKVKAEAQSATEIATVNAKAQVKINSENLKMQYRLRKMELEQELQLAKLHAGLIPQQSSWNSNVGASSSTSIASSSSSGMDYAPNTASAYSTGTFVEYPDEFNMDFSSFVDC
ncbi:hypothetical protein C8J56DRAFT_1044948 [Mycena floridula]|nr:hypothetical protein C8J56DRAFT_1044948 [Mycena floridula]